ncbi:MAG: ATP-binding protein [Deltaproteobacteria bacterium]|nr:ATP-binding protein [Deltaproteobacteria bacterium]
MREIVLAHRHERDALMKAPYIARDGVKVARAGLRNDLIKVIIGPRRAGKSVFAWQLLRDVPNVAYLNFDDERLLGQTNNDHLLAAIHDVYGDASVYFFDEIQNLPNWELFVNRLQRRGVRLVLTGSNSRLLSRELATHLTGRHQSFQLLPFSFAEYLRARAVTYDPASATPEVDGQILRHLREYLQNGGFPEVVVKAVERRGYLTTLFESVLFKDIVKRYHVRYAKKLADLGTYLLTNHANEFTATRLKHLCDFRSVHTVENYLLYLAEAFLLFPVARYATSLKTILKSARKIYGIDTGLVDAVKFAVTPDFGRYLENAVAIELLRRQQDFFTFKTRDGKEVDFVVKAALRPRVLIQVAATVDDDKTRQREVRALLKAGDEVACKDLLILTWQHVSAERVRKQTIRYRPLWQWLLED